MDFELTEEHRMIQAAARDFAEGEMAPLVEEAEEREECPVQLFPELGELGFIGISYPEDAGGSGAGKVAEMLYLEEINRICAGMSACFMVQGSIGSLPIYLDGTKEQKERYLRPALKGEKIGCFALSEPNAGSDVVGIETVARRDGDFYILNGAKTYITNGTICDYAIVAAYTDRNQKGRGISLFIVDRDSPGFIIGKHLKKMGNRSADTAELSFQDCRVPKENLLGGHEGNFHTLMNTLRGGRICYGARSVGVAQAAFEAALQYSKERATFGKPIGKHQAVAFKLTRMATELDAARILTYRCAWLYEQGKECMKEAAMLKLFATEMVQRVTWEAMQIFGGIGYMMESPVQRYFRDARLFTITEGTTEVQQMIIARELGL